jgi:metal-sulfur cluster biosynthetic enzyme
VKVEGDETMPIREESVYAALRQVRDPELLVNVVDLGLIYEVKVEEVAGKTNLALRMTMTTPACPWGPQLLQEVRDTLSALDGVGEVKVELTLDPPWTPDRMTEDARDELGMF